MLGGDRKTYVESPSGRSVLLPDPPYGSNWGKKMAVFGVFYPISLIVAFIALECVKRYWETVSGRSGWLVGFASWPPCVGQTGVMK